MSTTSLADKIMQMLESEMGPLPSWITGVRFERADLMRGEPVTAAVLKIHPAILRGLEVGEPTTLSAVAEFFGHLASTSWPDIRFLRVLRDLQ